MYQYPQEPKKIRERINRYERKLRKEYEKFGSISDGYGKRYLLGLWLCTVQGIWQEHPSGCARPCYPTSI